MAGPDSPIGHVYVEHDPMYQTFKVGYRQKQTIFSVVSTYMLESAYDPGYVIHDLATQISSLVQKDIEEQLKQHLATYGFKGKHLLQPGEVVAPSPATALHKMLAEAQIFDPMDHFDFKVASAPPEQHIDWGAVFDAYKVVKNPYSDHTHLFLDPAGAVVAPTAPVSAVQGTLEAAIPGLKDARATCPADHCGGMGNFNNVPVTKVIIHLNDHHKWTREKIADWLETLDYDLSFKTPEGGES